jgi:ATP-binding cassette subfamily C (CFTR/MRP) protein 1
VLQSWTQLESSLGAVSRIRTLGETLLHQDKESEDSEQSPEWLDKGAIEFQEIFAAYKYALFFFFLSDKTNFLQP